MPIVELNGIRLSYQVEGEGDLVLLIMGTGSPGRVWRMHQVPALRKAGFRVATIDNRGIPPTDECADGFTIHDVVADAAALIEHLGGPAHVIGTSLGSRITQELAHSRPDLVRSAVMLAAHSRRDPVQDMWNRGERALYDQGVVLPDAFYAAVTALRNLSPRTLADPVTSRDWLELFELSGSKIGAGVRAQLDLGDIPSDLANYRKITAPCLVVGYADDRVLPPHLAREVADAIPGARYAEIPDAGHFGFLERPEEVNRVILEFLDEVR
ncbi:hydrolase [Lentzea sp. NBRC 105346]|uniref:alpha/beta fold hydrolase n=1 Tax=Lentzea sp. NBRC 105346 TaxID=3032205 RepID=UPI00249FECE6|nr:alpha/beta fold hydrolase [Lentzea sp. NBRC 105346]GLZ34730.1 hydrolase [Lentzea sp. NBRC 105346]